MKYTNDNVPLNILEIYLTKNGWKEKIKSQNSSVKILSQDEYNIFLPTRDVTDEESAIRSAIDTIADYEEESSSSIYLKFFELKNQTINLQKKHESKDRISFRIISKMATSGRIPLDYAQVFLEGIKELVLQASDAERKEIPINHRLSKSAYKDLDKFYMGQTATGSYVINVESDLTKVEKAINLLGEPIPFERK